VHGVAVCNGLSGRIEHIGRDRRTGKIDQTNEINRNNGQKNAGKRSGAVEPRWDVESTHRLNLIRLKAKRSITQRLVIVATENNLKRRDCIFQRKRLLKSASFNRRTGFQPVIWRIIHK
jgi:hypothetical protein